MILARKGLLDRGLPAFVECQQTAVAVPLAARNKRLGGVNMGFERRQAENWRREVPGARWFKADLHIHTIDDAPGGRAKVPAGIEGPISGPEQLTAYARAFLQGTIDKGVQVLGLTPHSPRVGDNGDLSATWQIVEEWNSGADDQGVPFRERIFAVFPGFEPSLHHGRDGLHLLFLFDPEIGKDRYLQLFDLVMEGVSPWSGKELQMTKKRPDEVFDLVRSYQVENSGAAANDPLSWNYLVLAPHINRDKGLFETQKAQVLAEFDENQLSGLELADNHLGEDALKNRDWLRESMLEHRHAFFHSSDAYAVEDIGCRHVWLKMASPTIEALRQSFVASGSRLRIGYERDEDGELKELMQPPDATRHERPWLRSVTVDGKASFFGQPKGSDAPTRVEFSSDLTCVIGASMTGKSTLLDGLRVHIGAPLPDDKRAKEGVVERASERFLAGSASVEMDCPGSDPLLAGHEQWPAVFYTQGELQRLAQEPGAVEEILARLDASESSGIAERAVQLADIDRDLNRTASKLNDLEEGLAEAQQALGHSKDAVERLEGFASAGVGDLNRASGAAAAWNSHAGAVEDVSAKAESLVESVKSLESPPVDGDATDLQEQLVGQRERAIGFAESLAAELAAAKGTVKDISARQVQNRDQLRQKVDRVLADQGIDASSISEFQALNSRAALQDSYQANLDAVQAEFDQLDALFGRSQDERQGLVQKQRGAFDRVAQSIHRQFEGRIAVRRVDSGRSKHLGEFLTDLTQRGITRWWNECEDLLQPSPAELLRLLETDCLAEIGMSEAVQDTFRDQMTPSKRRELAALRCPDRYLLEFRPDPDDDDYRPLDELSGGQRVNILLSLLLEAADDRPLVIDQPEDELDNRFLFETLLPTLGRLKGRRQVILATHSANIVVNGDADQVVHLEASADRGFVAASGAIEDASVRDAIVRTVDGGDEAFRLRRLKYGF
ncbi:MAG: AAA family ATPase [bacterium]|nr:AAA family ATPase [bacterium]